MIDFHSHVLPAMDDGSRDVGESLSLLKLLKAQGAARVCLTPHFYANDESVTSFLKRRGESARRLFEKAPSDSPELLLGAEVRYYQGISKLDGLKELRLSGSRVLLLEMPSVKFDESVVRELCFIAGKSEFITVLAHTERCLPLQSEETRHRLREAGVLSQVNASFFTDFFTRRRALRLLEKGRIQFVGSDTHNTATRAPKLDRAYAVIERAFGEGFVSQMNEYAESVLAK